MSLVVVATPDEWAQRIRSHLGRSVEAIIAAGLDLIAAKADLGHGSFEAMVTERLGMSPRTAQMFMAVAQHESLANANHGSHLPASWRTLYELSRVPTDDLAAAIEAGEVTPDMERKAAKQLVARYATAPTKPKLRVVTIDDPEPVVKTYAAIVIDPPWRYDNKATRGAAEDHYPTMSLDELAELNVDAFADDRAHLYCWVTNGFVREGFDLLDAWGFTYKTMLTWVKPQMGMGNYFRSSTEHVLFATKGNLPTQANNVVNWFEARRGKHSAKPESFYDLVERSSPGPYLEMFARRKRLGWDAWGNEA